MNIPDELSKRLAADFEKGLELAPAVAEALADASPSESMMALMIVAKGIATVTPKMPRVVRWAELVEDLIPKVTEEPT